jgi:hypothetical protein
VRSLKYMVAGVVLFGAALVIERVGAESSPVQIIYEEAARYGVSGDWLYWVASCETGGTFNQSLVGRQGEIGIFQWHPRGLWSSVPVFQSWADVYDLRLNVRAAAWAFSRGLSFHWSCAR